jgi:hypothetical protein
MSIQNRITHPKLVEQPCNKIISLKVSPRAQQGGYFLDLRPFPYRLAAMEYGAVPVRPLLSQIRNAAASGGEAHVDGSTTLRSTSWKGRGGRLGGRYNNEYQLI